MIWNAIGKSLEEKGYVKAMGNVSVADFYIRVNENKEMTICSIIRSMDGIYVTEEQIIETAKRLERKFLIEGYRDVQIMHIIVTDQVNSVDKLTEEGIKFWIIDIMTGRLMVFENQPDDYEGLCNIIECNLANGIAQSISESRKSAGKGLKNSALITVGLMIINVIIFLICELLGGSEDTNVMLHMGALDYEQVVGNGQYFRLISCMFLHFGYEHLINNMLSLGIVGSKVEKGLGKLNYILIYFASGLGGGVTSLIYHMSKGDHAICAGASGAIYGLFGAIIACSIKDKKVDVRMLFTFIILIILTGVGEGVDFAAHFGGLAIGFITTIVLNRENGSTIDLE